MSKNTLLSNLINYISANSSGNVVVAAPTSGLALDVNGTGRFTGALTLGSTITNGTFTYTLPSATGTLALTSALGSYLPLSGGTLTGALNGTSATFTTALTAGNGTAAISLAINRGAAGDGGGLRYQTAGTNNWYVGTAATGTSTDLEFYNHNTATSNLKLSYSTGAATFSSSVTATAPSSGIAFQVNGRSSDNIGQMLFYANNGTTLQNYLQSRPAYFSINTETNTPIYLNTNVGGAGGTVMTLTGGGNVGIGTTAPTNGKLEIQQSATTAALWVQTGGTTSSHVIADFRTGTNANALSIYGNGNVGIRTTSALQTLTLAGTQMMYNTGGDGVANTVIGSITSQVRNYGTNIATNSFASIQFATDPSTWFRGDIRFLTNGSDGTGSAPSERMRITSGGNIDTKGNPIYAFSGAFSMGGTYQTIFTSVSDAVYLVSVNTNPSSGDGTYGLLVAFNEGDKPCGTIYGNNVLIQFSGNDVQIRSTNGSTYSVSWSATRIK